jgi:hypothetical protein
LEYYYFDHTISYRRSCYRSYVCFTNHAKAYSKKKTWFTIKSTTHFKAKFTLLTTLFFNLILLFHLKIQPEKFNFTVNNSMAHEQIKTSLLGLLAGLFLHFVYVFISINLFVLFYERKKYNIHFWL